MKITLMCPVCGSTLTPQDDDRSCDVCSNCGEKRIQIDFNPQILMSTPFDELQGVREDIYRNFLYGNPKYNKEVFEKRLDYERKDLKKFINWQNGLREEDKRTTINKPHCPICNSTSLSPISTTKKVAKIAMFGIFGMGDNGKTWKCNNCGSKF